MLTRFKTNTEDPITEQLNAWAAEDQRGDSAIFDLVYDRLHEIATAHLAKKGNRRIVQTTVVLNEAFVRLAGAPSLQWNDREHFFIYCSRIMRHVLVDLARSGHRLKRGSAAIHVTLTEPQADGRQNQREDVLTVHQALKALEEVDKEGALVVELKYFGGMESSEIATALRLSESTVHRRWRVARAWLFEFFQQGVNGQPRRS